MTAAMISVDDRLCLENILMWWLLYHNNFALEYLTEYNGVSNHRHLNSQQKNFFQDYLPIHAEMTI
jgi:hypothetical protein